MEMKSFVPVALHALIMLCLALVPGRPAGDGAWECAQYQYPFQDPDLAVEERVHNIISLMTLDENIACLGTNPSGK
jgi:hypothetical protein